MIFWWANGVLLRGLVFATDVDWSSYAIINSSDPNSIVIIWAIALVTMVMATRKKSRSQWFIGGVLLAVVICKLF